MELVTGFQPSRVVGVMRRVEPAGGVLPLAPVPALVWSVADTAVAVVRPRADGTSAEIVARRAGATVVRVAGVPDGRAVVLAAELPVVVTDPPPMPWPPAPPAETTTGGMHLRATVTPTAPPAGAPAGTQRWLVAATLTNVARTARTVRLPGCALALTLHTSGSWFGREGRPLAWDARAGAPPCAEPAREVTLAPGMAHALDAELLSTALLLPRPQGAGLAAGTYAVHARVAFDDTAAVVDAGRVAAALPNGPLAWRGDVRLEETRSFGPGPEPHVAARLTVRNAAELPVQLEYSVCNVTLAAYRTADATGTPAWDERRSQPWEGTYGRGCPLPLYQRRLAPGEELSEPFGAAARLIEVLGDSLPDGRYWFVATARVGTGPGAERPAPAVVPLGPLDLALAREPLPAERTYRFITYAARAEPTAEGARVTVRATLTHAGGSLVRVPEACELRLLAYRDRARRDAAPRSGAPDWTSPATGCDGGWRDLSMGRGDTRTLTADARAAQIVADGRPAGRYHLAALVRADGRDLYLSAGDAEFRR